MKINTNIVCSYTNKLYLCYEQTHKVMKTLDKLNKADKTNSVTKKDGLLKKRVSEAIDYMFAHYMHFSYYSGRGRYISLVTYEGEISAVLNLLGYNYKIQNDATKGGKQGDYFKMSKTAHNALISIV